LRGDLLRLKEIELHLLMLICRPLL